MDDRKTAVLAATFLEKTAELAAVVELLCKEDRFLAREMVVNVCEVLTEYTKGGNEKNGLVSGEDGAGGVSS